MIIKTDQEGAKLLTEILDVFLKTKGISGMQIFQTLTNNLKPFSPEELEALKAEMDNKVHPLQPITAKKPTVERSTTAKKK